MKAAAYKNIKIMILTLARGTFTEFGSYKCWKTIGFISIWTDQADPDYLRE